MDPTLWTIRISAICYALALFRGVARSRNVWTAGSLLFLAHVASAFQFRHHWSHEAAYVETARQTQELFGWNWGGGIYFNYLFTLVWLSDAAWWWIDEDSYLRRGRWITVVVQAYMAFMFFNGAVIFPQGPARWIALLIAMAIGLRMFTRERVR